MTDVETKSVPKLLALILVEMRETNRLLREGGLVGRKLSWWSRLWGRDPRDAGEEG